MTLRWLSVLAGVALVSGCGESRKDDVFGDGTGSSPGTANDDAGDGSGSGSGAEASDGGTDGDAGDGGPKLDVMGFTDLETDCQEGEECDGCTYVDLLFVIDNSGSMGDYQEALALAFPAFAQTLSDALPVGTNVHVGVTSSEMGYSSSGNTSIMNGQCTFIGDNGQPNDAFYVPPDVMNTGRNGAQGRLYDPGGGQYYYEFNVGDTLDGLETWFAAAATIGEGGSNIEMTSAPVGWVADPANSATNDGFVRDEGAVLVVFFMQDEPDQTPLMIDGQPGGQFVLDRLEEAKAGCGGTDCIIAGGFLAAQACSADGNLPLDDFLAGVGETPVVAPLPDQGLFGAGDPQAAADEMNMTLSDTLTAVIAETCDSIAPEG